MAKDDYNYIVHNILTYLYSCFQRKNSFKEEDLCIAAGVKVGAGEKPIPNEYFFNVLLYMQGDGLISGLYFTNPCSTNEFILYSRDINKITITSSGIKYLLDDARMKEIREDILNGSGIIHELAKMVFAG